MENEKDIVTLTGMSRGRINLLLCEYNEKGDILVLCRLHYWSVQTQLIKLRDSGNIYMHEPY